MKFLHPDQVIYIHGQVVAASGGPGGLRDRAGLESAIYRTQASFGGSDLYPDLNTKAAVLCHSLIHNHPFVDANKRTAHETLRVFLQLNGLDITAADQVKFEFLVSIAENKLTVDQIAQWLETHIQK
ncbi:type II toxin-antitoxin system death-on-curing family toxin [bacterium]|nr:type II toxin-antitoxin system death-on-curing family toxin [bacterium]